MIIIKATALIVGASMFGLVALENFVPDAVLVLIACFS